jgi:hypothetical protein
LVGSEKRVAFPQGYRLQPEWRVLERLSHDYRLVSSICVRAMQTALEGDAATALSLVQPLVWESLAPLDQRWVRAVLIQSGETVPMVSLKPLKLNLFEEENL